MTFSSFCFCSLSEIKIFLQGQCSSTVDRMFALHEAALGLNPGIPYDSLSSSGVIPENSTRSDFLALPAVTPPKKDYSF